MDIIIILVAALLPAILLWLYIWKNDMQKEPTSWLVKAVLWGVAIIIPVAILETGIEAMLFGVGGEPTSLFGTTTKAYDAIAMSGMIKPYIEAVNYFVLVYFCVKMLKVAKTKVLTMIEKERYNGQFRV